MGVKRRINKKWQFLREKSNIRVFSYVWSVLDTDEVSFKDARRKLPMDVNGTGNKTYLKNETIVGSNNKIKIKG